MPEDDANWEDAARWSAARLLSETTDDVTDAVAHLEEALAPDSGERPSSDDLERARRLLYDLETVLEETVAPVVDGSGPYESAAGHIPDDVLADRLLEDGAVPARVIETEECAVDAGGTEVTRAVVRFEVPEEVAVEVLEEHGELDVDALSDRLAPAPVVDGDPV